jgi:hypothetical protein
MASMVMDVVKKRDEVLQLRKQEREKIKIDSRQRYMSRAIFVWPIKTPYRV